MTCNASLRASQFDEETYACHTYTYTHNAYSIWYYNLFCFRYGLSTFKLEHIYTPLLHTLQHCDTCSGMYGLHLKKYRSRKLIEFWNFLVLNDKMSRNKDFWTFKSATQRKKWSYHTVVHSKIELPRLTLESFVFWMFEVASSFYCRYCVLGR